MSDFSAINTARADFDGAVQKVTETIMDLQLQQSTYEAAVAVTAKIIQPSLVDFLR